MGFLFNVIVARDKKMKMYNLEDTKKINIMRMNKKELIIYIFCILLAYKKYELRLLIEKRL